MTSINVVKLPYVIENPLNIAELRCSNAIDSFKRVILDLVQMKDSIKVSELMKNILELTGYEAELLKEKIILELYQLYVQMLDMIQSRILQKHII